MLGFEGFEERMRLKPAGHNVVISDRTMTVQGSCFVFETKKELDIFFE